MRQFRPERAGGHGASRCHPKHNPNRHRPSHHGPNRHGANRQRDTFDDDPGSRRQPNAANHPSAPPSRAGNQLRRPGGFDDRCRAGATTRRPGTFRLGQSWPRQRRVRGGDGRFQANEVKTVTAKLKHRIDGNELDKPVVATLANVQTLDPAGEKQPAPATVTYTAGPNEGDYGVIAFKSVSNRGIAEKEVTFTVAGVTLNVSLDAKMSSSVVGVSFATTVSAKQVVLTRQADGTYTGSGQATIGIKLGTDLCPEPFSEQGTIKLVATREVPTDPALPSHWTISYDPRVRSPFRASATTPTEPRSR